MALQTVDAREAGGAGCFRTEPVPREKVPDMPKKSTPLRVLVVEDELLIRWSVVETLACAGHSVAQAPNGAAAIRALRSTPTPIDVVLLDYRLPDSNDLSLLTAIRRLSPESSVVMMTAYGTPELTRRALDIGVHCVLNKPFDMQEMSAVVAAASTARSQ